MKNPTKISILILVVITLFLRLSGVSWGLVNEDTLQIDEMQHVGIAKNVLSQIDDNINATSEQVNARGFGTQIALMSYPIYKIFNPPLGGLYYLGRLLSVLYSVCLVLLVYFMALYVFKDGRVAFLSAMLLALFDLNATYSHYALPDIPVLFWAYLAVFLMFLFFKEKIKDSRWLLLLISLSVALSMSFKFDIIPAAIFVGALLITHFKKKQKLKETSYVFIIFAVLVAGFFYMSVIFDYDLNDFGNSKAILVDDNKEVVSGSRHYLQNPLMYLIALISGTSLPVIIAFVISLGVLFREKSKKIKHFNTFILSLILLELLLLWSGSSTFVRRANIFLPYIAIVTGYGLIKFLDSKSIRNKIIRLAIIVLICVYTLSISLVSQYNFITDTRYEASRYLNEEHSVESNIVYYPYAYTKSMPEGIIKIEYKEEQPVVNENTDVVVIHETYYRRYGKSFTTPFRTPACCEETFHCNIEDCTTIQGLLSNSTEFKLTKKFSVNHFLPERTIYKKFFGTYETFIGDTLIYERATNN